MQRRTNGAAVRVIREALGISQADLAARGGITAAYLSQIESGARQRPGTVVVRRLAEGMGVPLDSITYPWPGGDEFSEPVRAAS